MGGLEIVKGKVSVSRATQSGFIEKTNRRWEGGSSGRPRSWLGGMREGEERVSPDSRLPLNCVGLSPQ